MKNDKGNFRKEETISESNKNNCFFHFLSSILYYKHDFQNWEHWRYILVIMFKQVLFFVP